VLLVLAVSMTAVHAIPQEEELRRYTEELELIKRQISELSREILKSTDSQEEAYQQSIQDRVNAMGSSILGFMVVIFIPAFIHACVILEILHCASWIGERIGRWRQERRDRRRTLFLQANKEFNV